MNINKCEKCELIFDNTNQLNTHKKKFCQDMDHLDRLELELKNKKYTLPWHKNISVNQSLRENYNLNNNDFHKSVISELDIKNNEINILNRKVNDQEKKLNYLKESFYKENLNNNKSMKTLNYNNDIGDKQHNDYDSLYDLYKKVENDNIFWKNKLGNIRNNKDYNRNKHNESLKKLEQLEKKNKSMLSIKKDFLKPKDNLELVEESPFNEFFPNNLMINKTRNPDLNLHEKYSHFLGSLELDEIRVLEKIPNGTDLYRFKLEQLKELSTVRTETNKLIYEQMIHDLGRRYNVIKRDQDKNINNENWVNNWRQKIISQRIKRDLEPDQVIKLENFEEQEDDKEKPQTITRPPKTIKYKGYDPKIGLNIYFDYILGIDNRDRVNDNKIELKITYLIQCEGEELLDPKLIEKKEFQPEGITKLLSYILENCFLQFISPNPDTFLILEVQLTNQEGEDIIYGWTILDIFELSRDLKRGSWKIPIYEGAVDRNINKNLVQNLKPIYGCWWFLRIALADEDKFHDPFQIVHYETASFYQIPPLHIRVAQYREEYEVPEFIVKDDEEYKEFYNNQY